MRTARFAWLLVFLFLAIPSWGKQAPQQAAPSQPASDPQAVAVVQAAISALGGATAIGQSQSWTFQAQMQGSQANGNVEYVMSTATDTGTLVRPDGTKVPAPAIRSLFVPALAGAVLLKESQNPEFSLHYGGQSTLDSKLVSIIVFSAGPIPFPSQIWYFDAANLPVQIDFRLPAEIGARQSFYGSVALSDYRQASGVLHPFRMVTFPQGKPPQIVTVQSVNTSATASPNEYNGPGGDL
jgi:hypothetical protein